MSAERNRTANAGSPAQMIAKVLFLLEDVKEDCEMDQGVHALSALTTAIELLFGYVQEEGLGINVSDHILDLSARACR